MARLRPNLSDLVMEKLLVGMGYPATKDMTEDLHLLAKARETECQSFGEMQEESFGEMQGEKGRWVTSSQSENVMDLSFLQTQARLVTV